jgi:hypothetical protein
MHRFSTNRLKKTKLEMSLNETLALPSRIQDNRLTPSSPVAQGSGFNQFQL